MKSINWVAHYFMLLGTGCALIYSLDPSSTDLGFSVLPAMKFLPYILISGALILYLATVRFRVTSCFIFIILFCFLMLVGSIYAYIYIAPSVEETYLSRSLGLVVFVATYLMFQNEMRLKQFLSVFIPMILVYAFIASCIAILYRLNILFIDLTQVYQSQSVIIAMAVIVSTGWFKTRVVRISFILFYLLGLVFIAKTTSLALAAMTLLFLFYLHIGRLLSMHFDKRAFTTLLTSAILVVALSSLAILSFLYDARLEDRNNNVRESFFSTRFLEFIDSPFYGNLYTGTPLLDFGPLHIPSHSEWLDMLSSSGILAILLFMVPLLYLIVKSQVLSVRSEGISIRQGFAISLSMISLSMMVNPIFFMPSLATIFWIIVGGLAGIVASRSDYVMIDSAVFKYIKK